MFSVQMATFKETREILLASYPSNIITIGAPLSNCFGFVDGTVGPITRPGKTSDCYTTATNADMD